MSTTFPRTVSALATLVIVAAGLVVAAPVAGAAPLIVNDAQFRWGFNNESNNQSFNFGSFNFFSAGKLGNPEAGNQTLNNATQGATWSNGKAAGWSAQAGNVLIEKRQSDNSYALATWAGTSTDKDGANLGFPPNLNTKFSDHQVVINEGTGTVDPDADDADITWDGDFSVIYYSGMVFSYVSDPHLELDGGDGSITATLSGYGSDINNPDLWVTLPTTDVTLATLTNVDVSEDGLVTVPDYLGVEYEAPISIPPQDREAAHWGAFPSDFVDFEVLAGLGEFWYSSGGLVDKHKPTLPLTVTFDPEPGVVKVTPTVGVASTSSVYGRAAQVTVTVSAPDSPTATGSVTLTGGGPSQSKALSGGQATFTLPATLGAKAYSLKGIYAGDTNFNAAQGTKSHTIAKAGVKRPKLKVNKKPTPKAKGKATITVTSAVSGVQTTGKVTVTLTKGAAKKTVTTTLKNSKAAVALPKLAKGTWKLRVAYKGSANHLPATAKAGQIKVT